MTVLHPIKTLQYDFTLCSVAVGRMGSTPHCGVASVLFCLSAGVGMFSVTIKTNQKPSPNSSFMPVCCKMAGVNQQSLISVFIVT